MTKTSRSIRFDDDVWAKAQANAERLGLSVAAYLTMLVKTSRVRVDQGGEQPVAPTVAARRPQPTPASTPDPFDDIFEQIAAEREKQQTAYDPTLDPDSRQYDQEKARSVAAPWDSIA